METATREVAEGWGLSGLACLVAEGSTASTTSITTANLKKIVIDARKAIVKGKGSADTLLMSPDTFATMLEVAGAEFTPVANDYVNANAQVGKWLGCDVYETNGLAETTATYYDSTGSLVTATLSGVDFIMYNHNSFSIVSNLNAARIIDSENFVGSKAQVEVNTGYKVTNKAQVVVKKH